jgi:hypothetical protein
VATAATPGRRDPLETHRRATTKIPLLSRS